MPVTARQFDTMRTMPNASSQTRFGDLEPSKWPGERLGLPETGQGSVARVGRRIGAIVIDWAIAMLVSSWLVTGSAQALVTLGVFACAQTLFIPTLGGSLGHLVFGMRIVPIAGGWVGIWRPIIRTLLLCLVIPVVVWDSDQRGFHDKIPGTVLVRVRA